MNAYANYHDRNNEIWKVPTQPVTLQVFDEIVDRLIATGVVVDMEATTAARNLAPNVVVVVKTDGDEVGEELEYVKMDRDGAITYWGYYTPDCDTQLISRSAALDLFDEYDPCRITVDDLQGLRFVHRDGDLRMFYDEDDIYEIHTDKEAARKKRFEEQRIVSFPLPDEFLLLCEQYELTPTQVLRGFIADVCGIESYVNHPTIPPRTDDYSSHGSDERDLARQYFDRAHWSPDVEEKHGISLHY